MLKSMNWKDRIARLLVAAMVLGLSSSVFAQGFTNVLSSPRRSGPRTPNIIFILADDLGYGDLGCYGQKKIKTPNIDKLASEGMRFTQVYAGCTVCAPSRAALMTGVHSGHGLIRGNAKLALRTEDRTVAEVLKDAGYRTGAFGKWGLGDEGTTGYPGRKGFMDWFGFLDQGLAHNYYPEKISRYSWIKKSEETFTIFENQGGQKKRYIHDSFTVGASNFFRINYPSFENKYSPLFLYLAYTTPHANNELARATGNGMEVPSDAPYSAFSWPQPEKNKAAMITRLDKDVGVILATLESYKQSSNTVIFFSSDNGPHKEGGNDPKFFESSGPLRGIKRDLYEGGIRVPMIVWWPGKIAAGKVSSEPWAFWDFLPTAADFAGTKIPEGIDGISMWPTIMGYKQTNRHEFFYWEFHERGSKQAVRMGDWKAVRTAPDKALELYDLKTDVGEKSNVAEKNPDVVKKIEEYLKTARTESERWPLKGPEEAGEGKGKKKK